MWVELGQPREIRVGCEGARHQRKLMTTRKYTVNPWSDFLQAVQNHNFQLESLILAQNERWRQA